MHADTKAAIKTAPAAMSFTFPARKLYSGDTKSVRYSMAVLTNSVDQTMAMLNKIKHHSVGFRL